MRGIQGIIIVPFSNGFPEGTPSFFVRIFLALFHLSCTNALPKSTAYRFADVHRNSVSPTGKGCPTASRPLSLAGGPAPVPEDARKPDR